jgi:hypothetical protein
MPPGHNSTTPISYSKKYYSIMPSSSILSPLQFQCLSLNHTLATIPELSQALFEVVLWLCCYSILVEMCMTQLQAVGQSHSLTTALAWPEILESQSRQLRPWLSDENIWVWGMVGGAIVFILFLFFRLFSIVNNISTLKMFHRSNICCNLEVAL